MINANKPDVLIQAEKLKADFNVKLDNYNTAKANWNNIDLKNAKGANAALNDFMAQEKSITEDQIKFNEDWEKFEQKNDYKKVSAEFASKSRICNYLTAGFTVAMAILAAVSIYVTVTEMMEYYKVTFVPIPKYIVEEADITAVNERGETVMVQNQTAYYKAVLCNRTDGSSDVEKKNHEILKDRSDLNGDVGRQWLALYSVKYKNGKPILANSLKLKTGSGAAPEGYTTGIHMFGSAAAQNLTDSKTLCYNDPNDGTYVFFKQDDTPVNQLTATGSIVSGAAIAIAAVIGLVVGGLVMWLLTTSIKRRKQKAGLK